MNEAVFLSALRDDPADDVAVMALADFFDENGQPDRAELARLVLRLRDPDAADRAAAARVAALLRGGTRPVVAEVVNSIGVRLALVRPGRFRMGTHSSTRDPEELAHVVELTAAYYLGVFPVTQAQYEEVMGENVATFRAGGRNRSPVVGMDTSRFPVDQVTWDQAVAFCERLREREPGRDYRLPTEAEWEYACRAGTTTAFHFGDAIDSTLANFDGRKAEGGNTRAGERLARPSDVGSYPPNAFGLYDVHGNAMEWCADWYSQDYYRASPAKDPMGPASGERRVARGGCWYFPANMIRSASRNFFPPTARDSCVGFRVALTAALP